MRFHEKLAALAESRNHLSQRDVLRAIRPMLEARGRIAPGLTTVNRWYNGHSVPDIYEGAALAEFFGVPVDFLSDDALDEPRRAPEMAPAEKDLLRNARRLGIEEAATRLLYPPPRPPAQHAPIDMDRAAEEQRRKELDGKRRKTS